MKQLYLVVWVDHLLAIYEEKNEAIERAKTCEENNILEKGLVKIYSCNMGEVEWQRA